MIKPRESLFFVPEPKVLPWDKSTWVGLFLLIILWASLFTLTWGRWGNLTIDNGREMYAPAALAGGKTLYTDVWYPYTPAAPYLNALLFRIFGIRLLVLYCAGSLSALGCAVLLYASGLHLVSRAAAWTAGAVMLVEAFQPYLFCFPLGYSFGAVYACLAACLTLWLTIKACADSAPVWIVLASLSSAGAFTAKPEVGVGCFAVLAILIVCRAIRERALRQIAGDLLAAIPGVFICGAVIAWMISLRGAEFITQENLMSWPTSYFMKTYGRDWLNTTGLGVGGDRIQNLIGLLPCIGMWFLLRWVLERFRWPGIVIAAIAALILIPTFIYGRINYYVSLLFFPPATLFLIALSLPLLVLVWRSRGYSSNFLKVLIASCLPVAIALRSLFYMNVHYGIYTNGPAVLILLMMLGWLMKAARNGQFARSLLPSLATLAVVIGLTEPTYASGLKWGPIHTLRGTVYTFRGKAGAYQEAIHFIREKYRHGESVLSVPEDASLYFLSGVSPPTRVYVFTPGVLAPGKMVDDVISQIEAQNVKYLLWSNRSFDGYRDRVFGIDFDRRLGDYLKSRYHPAGDIPPFKGANWEAVVWERNQ